METSLVGDAVGWSNCISFPRDEPDESSEQDLGKSETNSSSWMKTGIAVIVGAGISVATAPLALGAVGFTGVGIAAGSLAAKMMSAAAIANGGGVAAGSAVAVLQSAGAAGLSLATNIGLGTLGGGAGAAISRTFTRNK